MAWLTHSDSVSFWNDSNNKIAREDRMWEMFRCWSADKSSRNSMPEYLCDLINDISWWNVSMSELKWCNWSVWIAVFRPLWFILLPGVRLGFSAIFLAINPILVLPIGWRVNYIAVASHTVIAVVGKHENSADSNRLGGVGAILCILILGRSTSLWTSKTRNTAISKMWKLCT
jgi:hypothetical protein